MKYASVVTAASRHMKKPIEEYGGQHAWVNRVRKLNQRVNALQPREGHYLSFHQTSSLQLSRGIELTESKSQLHGKSGSATESHRVEVEPSPSTGKAWYEEPISHITASAQSSLGPWESFDVSFTTGMKKPISEHHPTQSHSSAMEDPSLSTYSYKNHCVLTSASSILDADSSVVHVEFASGLVVAFYGQKEASNGKKKGIWSSQGQFIENQATVPVSGIALYNTSTLSFSVRRYVHVLVVKSA